MELSCCENIAITRRKNLPLGEFNKQFLQPGVPVVIEGALEDSPAREWTLDSLEERVGSNEVHVRVNTNCEDYRLGRKYNIRQTTFKEYIADIRKNNQRAKGSYLAVQNIKKAFPQIASDFTVPEYVGKVHGGPYLWIARQGHYEYCHFDADDGLLIMLQGTKNVRLFGCDVEPMYPNAKGTKGRTVQSQVDCDEPDLKMHPLFEGTRCHHCTLKPGEMLYIPAFWWHQVTSVEIAISINIFWGNAGSNDYLTKCMNAPIWPAFHHWVLNIVEQNKDCPSFQRTLARLHEALYNFLKNQWHEEATPDQVERLVEAIKQYLALQELPNAQSSGKHPPPFQIRGLLWRS